MGEKKELPFVGAVIPNSLSKINLDNYIIEELFFREDYPEYFTEQERELEAIVEAARMARAKSLTNDEI